jgi:hypothetical protein
MTLPVEWVEPVELLEPLEAVAVRFESEITSLVSLGLDVPFEMEPSS